MKKKIISLILAGIISASAVAAVSAEEEVPVEPVRAAGVVFTAESGYVASTYTGTLNGVGLGDTAGDVIAALENGLGIEMKRGDEALAAEDTLQNGDKIVLTAEDGTVKNEFSVLFIGDANSDNKINLADASAMLKKIAKWDVTISEMAADVNGDGTVNLGDVSTMLKNIAAWDVEFVKTPVLPGKYTMENIGNVPFYGNPGAQGWLPLTLSDGVHYDLAATFNVAEAQYAIQLAFLCHSLSDNEGSLRFSVYKWAGDYDTTVASMPVISEKFVDYTDNTTLIVDLTDSSGKGLVAGEYMWRIHEGYDDPTKVSPGVGIYYFPNLAPEESTGIKTFLNCKEFNIGPVVQLVCAKAK